MAAVLLGPRLPGALRLLETCRHAFVVTTSRTPSTASRPIFSPVVSLRGVASESPQGEPPNGNNGDRGRQEVRSAEAALKSHIQQLLELRASSTVLDQRVPDPLPSWQRGLSNQLGAFFQRVFADFLRARVDETFDVHEFLEGAKDAYWIVHKLIGESDYETLRGMASAKLLKAIEATGEEYAKAGLVWRTEIDTDQTIEAQLRRIAVWDSKAIGEYDEERAAEVLKASDVSTMPFPSGQWLMTWVQFTAAQQTIITRKEDATIVARLTDERPSVWTFACGPLQEGLPASSGLETPFWLLKFA